VPCCAWLRWRRNCLRVCGGKRSQRRPSAVPHWSRPCATRRVLPPRCSCRPPAHGFSTAHDGTQRRQTVFASGPMSAPSTHSACLPAAAGHTAVWLRFAPQRRVSSSPTVKGERRSLRLPLEATDREAGLQEQGDAPTVGLPGGERHILLVRSVLHLEAARQPPRRWSLGVDEPCQIRAQGHSLCVTATQSPSHRAGMSSYRCRLVSGGGGRRPTCCALHGRTYWVCTVRPPLPRSAFGQIGYARAVAAAIELTYTLCALGPG